jgi:hypothetical protein
MLRSLRVSVALVAVAGATLLPLTAGFALAESDTRTVIAWGDTLDGELNLPSDLSDVVAISAGDYHSLALKGDGTVVSRGIRWTSPELDVPAGLSDVVAIDAGRYLSMALKRDGTVVVWGNEAGEVADVPPGLADVVAISAGWYHGLALKSDGTVVAWGSEHSGEAANVPPGLSDVVAISAGSYHSLALRSDGTVVAWGNGEGGLVPPGLSGVVAISAGSYFSLALKRDGTVVAWGTGRCSGVTDVPAELSAVTAISAGEHYSLALRSDGTVVAWGDGVGSYGGVPFGLTDVVAISAGATHAMALGRIIVPASAYATLQTVWLAVAALLPLLFALAARVNSSASRGGGGQVDTSHEWRYVGSGSRARAATVREVQERLHGPGGFERSIRNTERSVRLAGLLLAIAVGPAAMVIQPTFLRDVPALIPIAGAALLTAIVSWFVGTLLFKSR